MLQDMCIPVARSICKPRTSPPPFPAQQRRDEKTGGPQKVISKGPNKQEEGALQDKGSAYLADASGATSGGVSAAASLISDLWCACSAHPESETRHRSHD